MAKSGTWNIPGEKVLPGVYNKIVYIFKEYGLNLNGTLAIPVKANWGPVNEVVTLRNDINKFKEMFGDDEDSKYTAYRLAELMTQTNTRYFKVVRIADKSAKQSVLELKNSNNAQTKIIKLTTKYPTSKEINVSIKNNIVHEKTVDMTIYEGTKKLCTIYSIGGKVDEMVNKINSDYYNRYVTAEKLSESTDPLAEITSTHLTGGNDGVSGVTNEDYIKTLDLFERHEIDTFVLDGKVDDKLEASVIDWVKKCYEDGQTIKYFTANTNGAEFGEALNKARKINNKLVSVVASEGIVGNKTYTYGETAVYLAALETGMKLAESTCNRKTIFTGVKNPLTKEELIEAELAGVITLDIDGEDIVQVDDVNTYTLYDEGYEDNQSIYHYNRTIRTLSNINKMLVKAGKEMIGKVNNDKEVGHEIVLSQFKQGFEMLISKGALKSFSIVVDEELQQNAKSDELYVKWDVVRMDKIKKIYGTGTIS